MESETFKMRKRFLGNFFNKNRVEFFKHCGEINIGNFQLHNTRFDGTFMIDTEIIFRKSHFTYPFKNYCVFLKPFIYFLYSVTYEKRFLYSTTYEEQILFLHGLKISFYNDNSDFNAFLYFPSLRTNYERFNFLNQIRINDHTKRIYKIHIKLLTCYHNISRGEYYLLRNAYEEPEEEPEYIQNETPIINYSQSFKSNECVICLTNPPNVLFCNCGHLCLCSECERKKLSNECPICKTENEIIRILN